MHRAVRHSSKLLKQGALSAVALALAAVASAQTAAQPRLDPGLHRVRGPVHHAGIFHVATGTWTFGGPSGDVGTDIVYNNSLPNGFYSDLGATSALTGRKTMIANGNLPAVGNGGTFQTAPDRTLYTINCFEIAYCDFNAAPSGWGISFYDSFSPCSDPTLAPVATFQFTNLPSQGCYSVTFDLSGVEFCLAGDGGQLFGGWDQDDPFFDSFGVAFDYLGAGAPGSGSAGLLLAGDPDSDEPGYNAANSNGPPGCGSTLVPPVPCPSAPLPRGGFATYFNPPGACASPSPAGSLAPFRATGRLALDLWLATDNDPSMATAGEGCYYAGGYYNHGGCGASAGNGYAAPHLVLAAASGECNLAPIGTQYCNSNPNSTGSHSLLSITGSRAPSANNVVLTASSLPMNTFGFFILGTAPGFVSMPAGSQGNVCIAGDIGRFRAPGQIKNAGAAGVITLDTSLGEWNVLALPSASGATYPAMVGTSSHFQLWHRDLVGGNLTSNFTHGVRVDWQ